MAKDISTAAKKLRVGISNVKPKMTYQIGLQISTKFIKKEFQPQIDAGLRQADGVIKSGLAEALNNAMESNTWGWRADGTTFRKNGEVATSPRNIVDTGALKKSLRLNIGMGNINIAYREPYSRMVHYGGYIVPYGNPNATKVYMPPRPWILSTLNGENGIPKYPIAQIYRDAILSQFR